MGLATLIFGAVAPIGRVEVSGARHLAADEAISLSGLIGRPLFAASASEARARLLSIPSVRDARVELSLTGPLRIALTEREATLRWIVGAVEWFVNAQGILFASTDPSAAPSLRVRDTRVGSRSAGDMLDPALVAAAVRLAKLAPGELRADARAPEVRVESGANGLVVATGAGWEIRFGGPERIDDKLGLALRFLKEQPDRRLQYVDVRDPDRIVFSPE